jgi:vancomycin resistance protein YoaR
MVDGIYDHKDSVAMVVKDDKPTVTDDMGDDIAVPDLLAQGITYYTGSSEPRRQNVERAATLEDGWLIAPDAVFSYNEMLGAVDAGNGFETGFGIVADEERGGVTTAPVMGGGICQVSTTIFQAAWWSGLEVVERYQHPYWLTGYGVAPLGRTGLDAMVNIEDDWSLDLKLRNTTGNWIAFVITADGDALTVSLMGTDPGWTIDVSDPIETGRVVAGDDVEYVDSPELPAGQELQVETALDGFSVRVDRTVRDADGNVLLSDDVSSDYAPSRNLVLRGTGPSDG